MNDEDLKSYIESEINQADGYLLSEISEDRSKALDYYLGRPFGNEEEGRSQVVSRDVADTVEWMLPSLLRIFTASDDYVRFEPVGPEDEDAADQESDVVNHVVSKQNNGFSIFHDWFKDALISKTGIVYWQWNDTPHTEIETYERLSMPELEALLSEDGVEPVEHTEYEAENPMAQVMLAEGALPEQIPPVLLHDVRIRRTETRGKCEIQVIPPEEFIISRRARHIEDANFIAHKERVTISEMRERGYPENIITLLNTSYDEGSSFTDQETFARDVDQPTVSDLTEELHEAAREVWLYTCYVRYDSDGDGVTELRRVVYSQTHILENEPADDVPYADLCPVPMPHRFHGQSVADLVMDLQLIKSTLWRQSLDNMYLTNNPMKEIGPGVNIDDLLNPRIGGLVRVKQMGTVRELVTTPMVGQSLQMLEYTDSVRESRTGVSRYNQGLDADSLNKTATGVSMLQEAANMRIELVARIFAETGVKRLFRGVHAMLMKHQDKEMIVRLRNEWVNVNPSEWRHRENMTITVGLGTGNKERNLVAIQQVAGLQERALAGGLNIVTPKNVYNTGMKLAEYAGLKDGEAFFTDPEKAEPQQPEQDPAEAQLQAQMQVLQLQIQGEREKTQINAEVDMRKAQMQDERERMKLAQERELRLLDIEARQDIERWKIQQKYDQDASDQALDETAEDYLQ